MESTDSKIVVVSDSHLGLFTVIGIALIILSLAWWKGYPWAPPPQRFNVVFHDIAGLNPNAAVYINGMKVGSVEQMHMDGMDKVRIQVKITSREIRVPVDSKVYILTNGIVGAKYVEIELPKYAANGKLPLLDQKSTIVGVDPVRTEMIVNELANVIEDLDVEGVQNAVKSQLARLGNAANNISNLSKYSKVQVARLGNAADNVSSLSNKLKPAGPKLTGALDQAQVSLSEMEMVGKRMNRAMDKRAPLLHFLFGRPGHIDPDKVKSAEKKKTADERKNAKDDLDANETDADRAPNGNKSDDRAM